jgi:aryl-alcohol dehydrogenase-like predicted oxidoreductase
MIQRRSILKSGLACGASVVLARVPLAHGAATGVPALIRRAIPASRSSERLPVIGVGTNNYSPTTPEERAARLAVLRRLTELGARVIDTAPAYRDSERVIGELLAEIGNRDQAFIATKIATPGGTREEGIAMLEESSRRLRTRVLDLVEVHNLAGAEVLLPLLRDWVESGRVRYVGITTSRAQQHADMVKLMRSTPLDFIQVDYSIANRAAADEVLRVAAEKGIAVLINLPFGGRRDGNLFARVRDRTLPPWAADFDASTWGQFFLKYVVSHPAVTCAIPGMTRVANLEDNIGAAQGRLPDAETRRRMEAWWDQEFGSAPT